MAEVIMPKMGDAMEEGTLLAWRKQDGDTVKLGDVIAEIETDKSNVEIEAEDAGALHIQARPGQTVPVGTVIATIGDRAAAKPAPPTAEPAKPAARAATAVQTAAPARTTSAPPASSSNGQERIKASPLARRVAGEKGVDLKQIAGTGPLGRIIEADVLEFVQKAPAAQFAPRERLSAPPTELSPIRKVIARRMTESKTTIPHFYVTSEVDMRDAMDLREKLNAYDDTLPKISLNDMVVKASAKALAKVPAVNAAFRDNTIVPGNGVHVGIAVALDDGLIVPVLRDADTRPLRDLAREARDLIKKARDKKLQPQEYSGGTFTVSNLGTFDVESFTAIIDPSQGAILAVASIIKKPVVLEDGETIAARPRMSLTFSGDHRAMDGATGARFLQEVKRCLQNPLSLLE